MIKWMDQNLPQSLVFIFQDKSSPVKFQFSVLSTSLKMSDSKHSISSQISQSCEFIEILNLKKPFSKKYFYGDFELIPI